MSDTVIVALITTLLGGGSILTAALKVVPQIIAARKEKRQEQREDSRMVMQKLDTIGDSVNELAPLIVLSLQVHKVELQGIKDGGLNGECERWHKKIDEELSKLALKSIQLEDKDKENNGH